MARSFSGSNSLSIASALRSAAPVTMACWFYTNDTFNVGTLLAIDSGNTNNAFQLRSWLNGPLQVVQAVAVESSSSNAATSTTAATNTWSHACGVWASATDRRAFLNGGNRGQGDVGSYAPSGLTTTRIGRIAATEGFTGLIAEAAIWNVALTDDEVAALYNNGIGLCPTMVRPDALVAYWPLLQTDGDIDWWGQNNLTANGSPTYADHPPVIYPSGIKSVVTAAAPTFKAAWARGRNVIITPGIV